MIESKSMEDEDLAQPRVSTTRQGAQTRIREFGIKSPSKRGKNFVLDTNVLLHDPGCLNRFKDNHICIPVDVLAELDRFKGEQSERGANARQVHRKLTEVFAAGDTVTGGVPTDGGGTVRLIIYDPDFCEKNSAELRQFLRVFPDRELVDHRILAATLLLMANNDEPVLLVTKDLNMQLKARAVGIKCEDYLSDKVDPVEISSYDLRRVDVDSAELQRFASSGELKMEHARRAEVALNQYVLLKAGEKQTMPARLDSDGTFVRVTDPRGSPHSRWASPQAAEPWSEMPYRCLIKPQYLYRHSVWSGRYR